MNEIYHFAGEGTHREYTVNSDLPQRLDIAVGDGSADQEHYVAVRSVAAKAVSFQGIDHAGHEPHVGAGEDADADDVHVLLGGGSGHLVRRDPHAEVDDLHAGVAEGAGDDLDAAVMAVQAELGEEDAGWVEASILIHSAFLPRILNITPTIPAKRARIACAVISSPLPIPITEPAISIAVTPKSIVPKSLRMFIA